MPETDALDTFYTFKCFTQTPSEIPIQNAERE